MAKVVVTGKIPAGGLARLKAEHDVTAWESDDAISRSELLAMVAGADAIVSLLTEKIDDELLDAAGPQLQSVSNVAVGYNNIDVPACEKRGVLVTNTPGVLTEATADIAMSLILMATRRLGEGERVIRAQAPWQWGMFYMLGMGLQGRQLGIVGMGQIGIATARRAKAFGMNIAYTRRSPLEDNVVEELNAKYKTMDELIESSDILSLHCPYSPATHHLMSENQFARMKKTAFLVNTARGPIVDEAALVAALKSGEIAGAGLDVFENEPTVHPGLLELDNAVLIPHLGSATVETRAAMADIAATNALAILAGTQAPNLVTS
ncbi:MAG: D-glycerate dehydrogenase [Candidatus Nanopelagicales bacterium]|nr:D-glycerate dehydrogenase [Candidatus Nanopelagicales bacterium]